MKKKTMKKPAKKNKAPPPEKTELDVALHPLKEALDRQRNEIDAMNAELRRVEMIFQNSFITKWQCSETGIRIDAWGATGKRLLCQGSSAQYQIPITELPVDKRQEYVKKLPIFCRNLTQYLNNTLTVS